MTESNSGKTLFRVTYAQTLTCSGAITLSELDTNLDVGRTIN